MLSNTFLRTLSDETVNTDNDVSCTVMQVCRGSGGGTGYVGPVKHNLRWFGSLGKASMLKGNT
jgi:hypothetical protein